MAMVGLVYTRTALTSAALDAALLGVASGVALLAGELSASHEVKWQGMTEYIECTTPFV